VAAKGLIVRTDEANADAGSHGASQAGQATRAAPGGGAWRFDDQLFEVGAPGHTIASALLAAGEPMTSRSAKYRRPRGPYCLNGDCGTCIVRVDGRPNIRACMTPWHADMTVERQNTYRPASLDPTSLVDRVFARGFDHHHLAVHPRVVNQAMQTFARQLTGFGEVPDPRVQVQASYDHRGPVVLVVGAGPAGRSVATALERAGVDHVVVDRHDEHGLAHPPLLDDPGPVPRSLLAGVGMFAAYQLDDLWAGGSERRASDGTHLIGLHTFRAPHVVLATGARDPMIPLVNNDLPGVVAARGLLRQLGRSHSRLDVPLVVVGTGDCAERCAKALHARLIDPDDVVRIEGAGRVQRVVLRDGTVNCDLVALAPTPAPTHEMAAQAGAELRFDGAGFAVKRSDDGVCATFNDTTVWAVGDLTGWLGPEAAAEDGRRVARNLLSRLAADPSQRVLARPDAPPKAGR